MAIVTSILDDLNVWMLAGLVLAASAGCRDASRTAAGLPANVDPLRLLSDSSGEVLEESWAAHHVRGSKVGHRHMRVFRHGGPEAGLLRVVSVDRLELRRFGGRTEQTLTMASLETDEGQVRQLAYQLEDGTSVQQAGGVVQDGHLLLTRSTDEGTQTVRLDWSSRQSGIFGVERSLRRQPMKEGERRTIEVFFPLIDRTASLELVTQGAEPLEVDGQARSAMRVEAADPRAETWQAPTIYWVDHEGKLVKVRESFLDRETRVVDASRATERNDSLALDLGVDVGVRVEPPIERPSEVKYAVYRVELDGLDPRKVFPVGASQRVLSAEEGVVLVTVRQVTPDTPPKLDVPANAPLRDDLEPNLLIDSHHPRIVAIATSVAGSIEHPWFAAQQLERHVHGRLSKTDVSQVFGSAATVAEQKSGDCSEHAVLLAAVCRARDIPARVAVGLVYSSERERFLYHMWNEVWIGDRWIPLDATLGPNRVGGCHIKLRHSNLADQTPFSLISPVMQLIERMKIDVVAASTEIPTS
jgi:transglutaminase-like putative cysteine protease